MKKVICFIAFALVYFGSVAQTFPQNPTNGQIQINNTNLGAGTFNRGVRGGVFVDTTSANGVPYIKGTKFMQINTTSDNNVWYRSADTMRWVLFATTTSNCAGTQLISGSVTWSGAGLVYDATDLDYYIICTRYFANATTLTLSVADPTFARIDKFYADNTDHVGVITGTPSANPQEPQVNPLTQIDLGFVYIPAGSTIPAGTIQTIIYNENVEWTGTSDVSGIDFASTSSPCYQSLAVVSPTMDSAEYISFQNGSTLNINNQQYLKFRYKKLSSFSPVPSTGIVLSFYHGSTQISEEFTLVNGAYGYDETLVDSCQLIVIPLTGIVTSDSLFDKLYITNNGAVPTFQLDYIYLLEGASVPPVISSSWSLNLNAGTNAATQGLGTSDSTQLNLKTNSETRAIVPANGFQLVNDTTYRIMIWNPTTKEWAQTYFPTLFASTCLQIFDSVGKRWIRDTCSNGSSSGWGLDGNAITAGQFLGTTNDEDLVFKRNSIEAGRIGGLTTFNTSYGHGSLSSVTSGIANSAFGLNALLSNTTGSGNNAFRGLGGNTTGSFNNAFGASLISSNGDKNSAFGHLSGNTVTTGGYNSFFGSNADAVGSNIDSSGAFGFEAAAGTRQMAFSPHFKEFKATGITGASNSGYVLTTDGTGIATFQAASGGSGTVTSVAMSVPSWLSVSGSPITTSGTLAVSAATGLTANQFLATPNGSTGAVSLRSIVANDLPSTLNATTFPSATVNGTITQALSANTTGITSTGYSLTGSNASSLVSLTGTLNTSGSPDIFSADFTNTASGASTNLINLKVGGVSQFKVDKIGRITTLGSISGFNISGSGFVQAAAADYVGWNGRGRFYSSSTTAIEARNSTNADYASVQSLYDRFGSGSPEGVVTAPVSAVYHRTDGTTEWIYVKETGTGNTGWVAKPKQYTAILDQTGTSAPTATVLNNTFGGTITWSYVTTGTYDGTLTSAFDANKTVFYFSNSNACNQASLSVTGANTIRVIVIDVCGGGSNIDDGLTKSTLTVIKYP